MDEPLRRGRLLVVALVAAIALSACLPSSARPPTAGVRPDGFPTGVFSKSFVDPFLGPMRLSWVFDADGRWAEVPEATAGQSFPTGPARGHYRVDGDTVRLDVDDPPAWGWTEHSWRLDGDRLWTTYRDSELPDDAQFYGAIDDQPWVRVP